MKKKFQAVEEWFDDMREDLENAYYICLLATDEKYRKQGYPSYALIK